MGCLHKTYVGAALAIHRWHPNYVTPQHLAKIAEAAIVDFDNFRLMYPNWREKSTEAEQALRKDLYEVNLVLAAAGLEEVSPMRTFPELEDVIREQNSMWFKGSKKRQKSRRWQ